jgi:hypothetical protein
VIVGGHTQLADPVSELALVREYVDAGASWWVERFHAGRGSLDDTLTRLMSGPPEP